MKDLSIKVDDELADQLELLKEEFSIEDEDVLRHCIYLALVIAEGKSKGERLVMIDENNDVTREFVFEDDEITEFELSDLLN